MRITTLTVFFVTLIVKLSFGQTNQELLNEIRNKSVVINSIDFGDKNYIDLEKLIPVLKNIR